MIRSPRVVLALLTALNLLNYVDRMVLSAVLAPLQGDLHLSNFVAGWLPTIFLIGYFATSPVFGSLGDRGAPGTRKRLIALGIAVWSVATIASGLAQGALSLAVARAFVGLGEASYATLAPTLIDDLAPREGKSRWMAIFYSATPIGSALGYILGGSVMHAFGWRAAFYVAGAPGLAAGALCLLIAEPARTAGGRPAKIGLAAARALTAIPLYRNAVLGYCVYSFAIGGFAYWAPTYLHVQYGMDAGKASFTFGLVTVAAGALGTIVGGLLADRATRAQVRKAGAAGDTVEGRRLDDATARGNVLVCALGSGLGAPLALMAIAAATASGFFFAAFPTDVALFLLSGPINVAILRSSPPELRASAMALSIFAIHALGDLWSPPLIGLVADHAPMQLAMYVIPVVFAGAALVWWRAEHSSRRLT